MTLQSFFYASSIGLIIVFGGGKSYLLLKKREKIIGFGGRLHRYKSLFGRKKGNIGLINLIFWGVNN